MVSCMLLASLVVLFAQAPEIKVDYGKHLHLWRAQKGILSAYENINQAQASDPLARSPRVEHALKLLMEANREINKAAVEADKH